MSARILIDGYNLLCAVTGSPLIGDIEEKRNAIISSLAAYKRLKGVKITIVFDGTQSGNLQRGKSVLSGIDIVYTREGETADSYIKKLSAEKGSGLTIISSDRDIALFAGKKGAVCLSSEEFSVVMETAAYYEQKGLRPEDEDYESTKPQKGPSKRLCKKEREKLRRLKKL